MSQSRTSPPPILFIFLFLLIAAGGYWWFFKRQPAAPPQLTTTGGSSTNPVPANNSATAPAPDLRTGSGVNPFSLPTNIPSGTAVKIDGSTSMVVINKNLKDAFEAQYPGVTVTAQAGGSSKGIQAVLSGSVDIAATSRPLKPEEQSQGLVMVPVAEDEIALVVGVGNPFGQSLTQQQVVQIFQGQITDWSQVGGSNRPIRVINRPEVSGTHQAFKELVLVGGNFGTTPNITTLDRDATTPMLQSLGDDGIGYATAAQIKNQKTVRMVAIDGLTPDAVAYPYKRTLYYAYKNPSSPAVAAFLGFVGSPQGQSAIVAPTN
jgi:phosphate transport system substrate-binding protein